MNNLTAYFNEMSLQDACDAKFETLLKLGMPADLLRDLHGICNMSLGARGVYQYLHIEDELFTRIYGEGEIGRDGVKRFVYPFVVGQQIPDGVVEVCGPIGTQTSKWHYETLQQHAALVAANACDEGLHPKMAVALAVLHDIGKKYTAATNKYGGVCFHGHAKVSAFIAAHWLSHWMYPMDWETMRNVVAVTYAHMLPHDTWKDNDQARGEFYRELVAFCDGNKDDAADLMSLIATFEKCDVGVETEVFTPELVAKIKRGEDLILNTRVCS